MSNKYSGSTLAMSSSLSILKVLKDIILIFFLLKYSKIVLFTDSGYGVNKAIFFAFIFVKALMAEVIGVVT